MLRIRCSQSGVAAMRKILVIAAALAVTACSSPEPGIDVRTVEVPVIRVTTCLQEKDIPKKPTGLPARRPKSISQALDVAVAKVLEGQNYADKADALLRGCAKP